MKDARETAFRASGSIRPRASNQGGTAPRKNFQIAPGHNTHVPRGDLHIGIMKMKNQYYGDINDYIKYGILRALSDEGKMPVHVCWMLTPNDGGKDGRKRDYLDKGRNKNHDWATYDSDLFTTLERTHHKRDVAEVENNGLFKNVTYYYEMLNADAGSRENWFEKFLCTLNKRGLVFFDPDNGIEVKSKPIGKKDSCKYLFWHEVAKFWKLGHSLLIYQHFPRVNRSTYLRMLSENLRVHTGATEVVALSTSSVAFLLLSQPGHQTEVRRAMSSLQANWKASMAIGLL
jgi:hypothetical protein